jgi:hypothetical protein
MDEIQRREMISYLDDMLYSIKKTGNKAKDTENMDALVEHIASQIEMDKDLIHE